MKKLIIILFSTISIGTMAQKEIVWDYPVKPGTDDWNNLRTEKDRIKALQIPDSVLARMHTKEFAKTLINFPLFGYYTAFNTPQEGFDIMSMHFNIFQFLCKKDSVGEFLISIYKNAEIHGWKYETSKLDDDFWTLKLGYIEHLLAQKEVIQDLNLSNRKTLISEARDKLHEKLKSESFNSLSGTESSLLIISRILESENELQNTPLYDDTFQRFLQTGQLLDNVYVNEVLKTTDLFLHNK
jgi:hypothetical protein